MPAKLDIDLNKLEALLASGATQVECAEIFGCCSETIHRLVKANEIPHKREPKLKGTETSRKNQFGHNKKGRKPKTTDLQKADMSEIEAEFSPGWDSYDKIGW